MMSEAGVNLFRVDEHQEPYVRRRPVFFLTPRPEPYPECFYRANWRGITMFMDEPAVRQAWYFQSYPEVAVALKGPAGAARMLEARVRETREKGNYARNRLHKLLTRSCDLGSLVIDTRGEARWYKRGESVGAPPLPRRSPGAATPVPPRLAIRAVPDETKPLTLRLVADIDNGDEPAGLRSRAKGTEGWRTIEAVWHVFEDPDIPAFGLGAGMEHAFAAPGSYRVLVWTCDAEGVAARAERFVR